jgi:hypothetical protein
MAFRTLIGLIVLFATSSGAWADAIQLNPSHPEQYTVTKDDTLWDISSKFLIHPWQWPELWSHNSQIKDPHTLYPGDTLYFSMAYGRPELNLARSDQAQSQIQTNPNSPCVLQEQDSKLGRTEFPVSEGGKLLPCIRVTELKKAIRLIPTKNIASYLSSPKVVGENELGNAPYVVDFAGEHIIVGTGDRIYVRSITESKNQLYTIYRPGSPYISPDSGEVLGYEAEYIAEAMLQQSGDPATLVVSKVASEIRTGDRLMPNAEEDIALNYFPRPPVQNVNGNIISVLGGVSQIGLYNVVVIDKGTADGMQSGHELSIYKRGSIIKDEYSADENDHVNLPDENAGTLMVFRPFEHVSYALVMKATQALHVLDKVKIP